MYLLGEIKLPQIKLIHSNAAVLKDVCWFSCVPVSAAVYWDSKQKECSENGPLLLVQQYKYWPKSSSRHYISILINLVLYLTVGPIFLFYFLCIDLSWRHSVITTAHVYSCMTLQWSLSWLVSSSFSTLAPKDDRMLCSSSRVSLGRLGFLLRIQMNSPCNDSISVQL